jgi:hypothetical protein
MMTSQNPTLDSSAKDSLARIPSRLKRLKPSKAKLALGALGAMLAAINTALAGPILTEIHYNGLANGSDPDEFIELTNPGEFTLDLSAWQFTQGINYSFAQGQTLAPATSLLIARDPSGFLEAFPEYQGDIFDFSGALSNSGETLTLADAAGIEVWSISYDDTAPWPRSPDGLGDSLQLITDALDAGIASNWKAQSPSPVSNPNYGACAREYRSACRRGSDAQSTQDNTTPLRELGSQGTAPPHSFKNVTSALP